MSVRPRIGELLVNAGLLSREQLDAALDRQRAQGASGRRLGQLLVALGYVSETQLAKVLSQQLSVPWVSLHHIDFSRQLLSLVPRAVAEEFCLIPVYVRHERRTGETLYLAMEDPTHDEALRRVRDAASMPVKAMIAAPSDIRAALRALYGDAAGGVAALPVSTPGARMTPAMGLARPSLTPTPRAVEPDDDATPELALHDEGVEAISITDDDDEASAEPAPSEPAPSEPAPAPVAESAGARDTVPTAPPRMTLEPAPAATPPPVPVVAAAAAPEAPRAAERAEPTASTAPSEPAPIAAALAPAAADDVPLEIAAPVEAPASSPAPSEPLSATKRGALALSSALEGAAAVLPVNAPASAPLEAPRARTRPRPTARALSVTLLDGTTIQLPAPRRRRDDDAPSPTAAGMTAQELIAALRAVAHGADAEDTLGEARVESVLAALLTTLLRKQLVTERELLETLAKM